MSAIDCIPFFKCREVGASVMLDSVAPVGRLRAIYNSEMFNYGECAFPAGLPLPARNLPNARALPRPTDCLWQFLAKKDRISGLVIYRFCGYVVHSLSHAREERHQKAGQ